MLAALLFLADAATSAATDQPATPANPLGSMLIPIILMMAVFYFLMLRPNQRQEKQRQAMVAALKRNDKVVNSGGIIGIVESIKDKEDEVVLKGGVRITRSSIVRVIADDAGKEQKDGGA